MKRIIGDVHLAQPLRLLRLGSNAKRQGAVCLICQQRALTKIAPFSSTSSQKLRRRPARPTSTTRAAVEHNQEIADDADQELIIGGERTSEEARADAQEYEARRRQDEQNAFQQAVEDATEQHYLKASNWDGMEMVGGEKEWPHGERRHFQGFLPAAKITEPYQIRLAIHRATIEVYSAQSSGRSVKELPDVSPEDLAGSEVAFVDMKPSPDGSSVELRFPNEGVRQSIIGGSAEGDYASQNIRVRNASDPAEGEPENFLESSLSPEGGEKQTPEDAVRDEDAPHARKLVEETSETVPNAVSTEASHMSTRRATFDRQWSNVSISHPFVKLAVMRRVTQLTGHVFPDTIIQSASTIGDLSRHLIKLAQKPKTLYEELVGPAPAAESKSLLEELLGEDSVTETRGNALLNLTFVPGQRKGPLTGLPNVVVSGKRVTPIDKEKAVGRWKVIEAELDRRRLPVIGRN